MRAELAGPVEEIESALRRSGVSLGPPLAFKDWQPGMQRPGLWLLRVRRGVSIRQGAEGLALVVPPLPGGTDWLIEVESWVTLEGDPADTGKGERLHREHIAPRLRQLGLALSTEQPSPDGYESIWTTRLNDLGPLAELVGALSELDLDWYPEAHEASG